ncbi:hypothetical protein KIN20_023687 [Parelaphostrongylus tenuis]|uniref:Uncharacterized protein n=1 Tax=Parelaphostrongylus tenuis TaxID=148309 RepID=A0AAD5N6T3_PARTN|nr:hypothetical protein KIN20_023687 [Parelaphostrongylus tenuis]
MVLTESSISLVHRTLGQKSNALFMRSLRLREVFVWFSNNRQVDMVVKWIGTQIIGYARHFLMTTLPTPVPNESLTRDENYPIAYGIPTNAALKLLVRMDVSVNFGAILMRIIVFPRISRFGNIYNI